MKEQVIGLLALYEAYKKQMGFAPEVDIDEYVSFSGFMNWLKDFLLESKDLDTGEKK